MGLISINFLLLAVITIVLYFIIPKKVSWVVLLVASLIFLFYDNFNIKRVLEALIVFGTSYSCGILIDKYHDSKKAKVFLVLGIAIIIGLLSYLKYSNLFINTVNHMLSIINLPYSFKLVKHSSLIGLSYYSLIMISYLVDIYRGTNKSEKNPFKLALFMSYFPILTSGPFIKYNEMKEHLYNGHKFDYDRMCRGLLRIAWGLFKILVISLRIGIFVDKVYGDINTFNGVYIIIAMLLYTTQLYTNFSGSIDIIMGVSEIMGIPLPENFTAPFFSRTITELWRNWHITLGGWLRDYIFYPLLKSNVMQKLNKVCKEKFGKKIGKKIPLYLSMLIMWILIGIWHSGAYSMIIGSGLLQFVYMFFEDNLSPLAKKVNKKLKIDSDSKSYHIYQTIRTYVLFSFSMIFFRALSVKRALKTIKNIFVWNPWVLFDNKSIYEAGLDILDFRVLIIALIVLFVVEKISRKEDVRDKLFKCNIFLRWTLLYALIFAIIIFGCYGVGYDPAKFIYQQF